MLSTMPIESIEHQLNYHSLLEDKENFLLVLNIFERKKKKAAEFNQGYLLLLLPSASLSRSAFSSSCRETIEESIGVLRGGRLEILPTVRMLSRRSTWRKPIQAGIDPSLNPHRPTRSKPAQSVAHWTRTLVRKSWGGGKGGRA